MTSSITVECLIFLFFFYFASNPATCSTYEADLRALVSFKENIVDPRGALDSWRYNETANYCTWKGISCSRRHRTRVVSIDLQSQGLVGSLSPHLGNLSFLRSINLQTNSFHGPIPQELGRLRRLEYIVLSNNTFDGEIPRNLSQCWNLYYLDFFNNKLMGNVPFELSSLLKLKTLVLSKNNLSGIIPSFIGNFTLLRRLSLNSCGFQGEIPDSLAHLQNLRHLVLEDNMLTGRIPYDLYNISTILTFGLSFNYLQGNIPSNIGFMLPNLVYLGLGDNNLTGPLPVSLSNASFLQAIGLFRNKFTGPMPKNLDRLSDLLILSIWSTDIQDDISFISSLTNCTKLKILSLSDNLLTGSLPHSMANLSTQLNRLSVGLNLIHGIIPSGSIPSEVGSLSSLVKLELSNNKLSGLVPRTISSCISLQQLNLAGNSFHGEIPQGLSSLKGLQELDLSRNKFSGLIPNFLGELSLEKLNLSFNKLQGPVPVHGVFQNVSAVSLEENTELCGGISKLKLPPCPPTNPKKKNSHIPLKIVVPVSISGAIFIAIIAFSYIFIQCRTKSRNDLYTTPFESNFPRLSYADILRATDGFSEANMIGYGRIWFKANGSLEKWLHQDSLGQDENTRYLTFMQRMNIAIDVASAVEYLHNGTGSAIVHGDLKPSNILLDDDMSAHVGDFGLSKVISNVSSSLAADESHSIAIKGTIGYIAPGQASCPFLLLLNLPMKY
ncbi:UNVERIFIED_CONTAM: putative LRR receptor-like serine/threonine-protein kinase [Sesamum radiatum]|uniref:LRR receptor-like serine/threonine-protein kinase n=1 Tax=Sesamum radiatum TaxID=300843 RepID=A0AAW2PIJ5_SESRA